MKLSTRRSLTFACCALLALLVAGCSGGAASTTIEPGTSPTGQTPAAETSWSKLDSASPPSLAAPVMAVDQSTSTVYLLGGYRTVDEAAGRNDSL